MAMASFVAYLFRYSKLIHPDHPDVRRIESFPTFLMKDSDAYWLKLNEKVLSLLVATTTS